MSLLAALSEIPTKQTGQELFATEINTIVDSIKAFALYGEVKTMAHGIDVPNGWVLCDGASYAKSSFPNAYAKIGDTFGSDVNTFKVPDLRGKSVLGNGSGVSLTPRVLGDSGGVESVILSEAELPSHSHSLVANLDGATTDNPTGASLTNGEIYNSSNPSVSFNPQTVANTGGNQAHENMSPFLVLNYYIYIGVSA